MPVLSVVSIDFYVSGFVHNRGVGMCFPFGANRIPLVAHRVIKTHCAPQTSVQHSLSSVAGRDPGELKPGV